MLIPYHLLDPETLDNLIEDFVTRDGTDNGDETSLEQRSQQARQALHKQQAFIVFDADSQQCLLLPRHDIPPEWLQQAQQEP